MTAIFDRLQHFLHSVSGHDRADDTLTREDPRVAMVALFFHVIEADGFVSDNEKQTLQKVVRDEYALDDGDLEALVRAGQKADDEAVDLFHFTSVLKRSLDGEQKVGFIELLWELVYADGKRDELEDNIVWRVAELLGVSGRDRVLMRKQVADRMDSGAPANDHED